MFSWICPKCGNEVPPAYTECPNCVLKEVPVEPLPPPKLRGGAAGEAAPPAEPAAPVAPVFTPPASAPVPPAAAPGAPVYVPPAPTPAAPVAPPPTAYAPQGAPVAPAAQAYPPMGAAPPPAVPPGGPYYAPAAGQPPYYPVPPRKGMPSWLSGLLFGLLFVVILGGAYWFYQSRSKVREGGVKLEPVPAAGAQSELEKVLEVTGLRVLENEKKQTQLVFLVVNHSRAELKDVEAQVLLRRTTDAPEAAPISRLNLKVSLEPYQSKEFNTPLQTTLRAYELPDWQFLKAEVKVLRP